MVSAYGVERRCVRDYVCHPATQRLTCPLRSGGAAAPVQLIKSTLPSGSAVIKTPGVARSSSMRTPGIRATQPVSRHI